MMLEKTCCSASFAETFITIIMQLEIPLEKTCGGKMLTAG